MDIAPFSPDDAETLALFVEVMDDLGPVARKALRAKLRKQ